MKKSICLTAITLALMSSASAVLAILATNPIAYAGESPGSAYCQKTLRPVTSGGAVREQLALITKCNSKRTIPNALSVQPPKSSPITNSTNVPSTSTNSINGSNTCGTLLGGNTGGVVQQNLEASRKCNSQR